MSEMNRHTYNPFWLFVSYISERLQLFLRLPQFREFSFSLTNVLLLSTSFSFLLSNSCYLSEFFWSNIYVAVALQNILSNNLKFLSPNVLNNVCVAFTYCQAYWSSSNLIPNPIIMLYSFGDTWKSLRMEAYLLSEWKILFAQFYSHGLP